MSFSTILQSILSEPGCVNEAGPQQFATDRLTSESRDHSASASLGTGVLSFPGFFTWVLAT